jgi:uncharacterized protein (UPF0335 family)
MAQASIFNTIAPQTTTTTPTTTETTPPPDTPPETDTTTTEDKPDESTTAPSVATVTLEDGSQIPADQYVKTQLAEETAKLNSEWDKVRAATLEQAEQSKTTTPTTTQTEKPSKWKVEVADEEEFQSDVEKRLVNSHNALGDEVSKEVQELRQTFDSKTDELDKEIQATKREAEDLRTQRQIDTIERTKGITEAELQEVYNEFNGSIQDVNAIAEVVSARKITAEASQERTKEATEDRKEAVSNVSGAANATPTGETTTQEVRKLAGKEKYSGAAIAAKYRAFN